MQRFSPPNSANVKFSITVPNKDAVYFQVHSFRGMMYLGVSYDGVVLFNSKRCVSGEYILPKSVADIIGGNFMWETVDNRYPSYEDYGDTCFLDFYTLEEMR